MPLALGVAAAPLATDRARALAAEVLQGGDYQRQLPAERARELAEQVLRGGGYQRQLPARPPTQTIDLPLGWLPLLLKVLAWTGLAVLVVLAAVWLWRRLHPPAEEVVVEAEDGVAVAPARIAIAIASAEALAAAGRYGEAIHALLLSTLQALSRAARLPRSYTSREIVTRVPLRPGAREALQGLVEQVEVSWFGGATPDQADYQGCLDRFHAFQAIYRGGP